MLWTVVFLKRDLLCALVQFASALAAALSLYGIARRMGLPRALASLCVIVFLGLPEIVLQSTSTQNDLVTAWLCAATIFFLIASAQSGNARLLAVAAIAGGLAAGTKPTAWLLLPGAAAIWLVMSWKDRTLTPRSSALALCVAALGFGCFVAPQMLRNHAATGYFVPPVGGVRVESPGLRSTAVNLIRT